MSEQDWARQQLVLQAWFSPAFPIGGFAFSHGLEWAYESGAITTRAELEGWIGDLLHDGSGRTDAILLGAAHRAATAGDHAGLQDIIDLGAALQPSAERHLEATVQGGAFLAMVMAAYPCAGLTELSAQIDTARLTLPVAVGLAGAAHRIGLPALLTACLGGFVANLASAAVRLGIVGQTDGQRIISSLNPVIADVAAMSLPLTLEHLGSATLRADLVSLQHETQYSRLFRS